MKMLFFLFIIFLKVNGLFKAKLIIFARGLYICRSKSYDNSKKDKGD